MIVEVTVLITKTVVSTLTGDVAVTETVAVGISAGFAVTVIRMQEQAEESLLGLAANASKRLDLVVALFSILSLRTLAFNWTIV